jgi:hypothetical protein
VPSGLIYRAPDMLEDEHFQARDAIVEVPHPAFRTLTFVSAALNICTGVIRIFMLDALSANAYVILSRVVFVPLNIAFYLLCYVMISRVAIRIWPAALPPPPKIRDS